MLLASSRKLSVRGTLLRGGALEMSGTGTFNVCPRGLGEALGGVQRTTQSFSIWDLMSGPWQLVACRLPEEKGILCRARVLIYTYMTVCLRDNIKKLRTFTNGFTGEVLRNSLKLSWCM